MKRTLAMILAGSMCLGMLAACGGGAEAPAETKAPANPAEASATGCVVSEDANITVVDYAEIKTLHPLDGGTVSDAIPVAWAYEPLLRVNNDLEYEWLLATGYEVDETSTKYTFFLREGIEFSDGTPWNAEAAKANFDLIADQSQGYAYQYLYECMDSTEVIDEYTICITLKEVFAPFLLNVAGSAASMMSPSLIEKGSQAMASEVCGTGQYTFVERVVGEYCLYELNRDWWGYDAEICGGTAQAAGDCGFNSIKLIPINEEATRVALIQSGEADLVNSISYMNYPAVEASGSTVMSTGGALEGYFYLNTEKEVFKDIRVRQAVAMAIDLNAMNAVVYGNENAVATSVLTPSSMYYEAQKPYGYDVEAAKALMAEAGYPDGFSVVAWEENDTTDIKRGEFIQQQLEAIGITLEVFPQDGGFLTDNVNNFKGAGADAEFDCYIRGYIVDTDPDDGLGRFSSTKISPMAGNYSFYKNDRYDELVKIGATSVEDDVRREAYTEAQRIIWDDVPVISLLNSVYTGAHNGKVEGATFTFNGTFDIRTAKYVG